MNCGSTDAWGDLRSCDAAVLIEVIEHLDPGPLADLAPALLGTLQPPLLLVTTPNRSYNGVMEAVGLRPLHNGLRNRDHRFEWCAHMAEENIHKNVPTFKIYLLTYLHSVVVVISSNVGGIAFWFHGRRSRVSYTGS